MAEGDREPLPIVHSGGSWIPPRKVVLTDLYDKNDVYLIRWILFRTPWFGVQVHCIVREDRERHLHNHPRAFVSLVLRGGYREQVDDGWRNWPPGSIHRMSLSTFHSIRSLPKGRAWTLLLVGPDRQKWGFMTEYGFVEADDYPLVMAKNG